jgi:hypothetical protein
MRARRGFQRASPVYIQKGWMWSTVVSTVRDWTARAASADGIMSQVQGTGGWRRWRPSVVANRPVLETLRSVWFMAGSSWCTTGLGKGGVVTASPCRVGVHADRSWTGCRCTGTSGTLCALWAAP